MRESWSRRAVLQTGLASGLLGLSLPAARAADFRFFRIGTGSTAGTYFPVGGLLTSAISNPPGGRACERGGSCGPPGLIAAAISSHGSVANIDAIASGQLESGLSQADIAHWAYTGTGIYRKKGEVKSLRVIANLFPEAAHLVVQRNIFARDVTALRGKRISIDREGSGTRVDALMVLRAFGLGSGDIELFDVSATEAAHLLRLGELDGFFFVAGTPAAAVDELARESLINLVPISGPPVEKLLSKVPFFAEGSIPAGTYFNVGQTRTISVGAQWLVSADVPDDTVYRITASLWHERSRAILDGGHPKGRQVRLENALMGLGVPLHAGAERYYREAGLLTSPVPETQ